MSLLAWYARRPRTVNGQFMFLLALAASCGEERGQRDAGAAAPVDDRVTVTRTALGGHCPSSNVVEIDTCQELQNMELDLCGRYELTTDLDCSMFDAGDSGGFRPVGNCWPWDPFSGDFDGGGHVITGLTINRPSTNYVGLFGCAAESEIQDIGLEDASIAGGAVVGSIAGVAYTSEISRVFATGSVTGGYYVGGLVGWLHDDVVATDAYAQVEVTAVAHCGLAFGKTYVGNVSNLYASGTLSGCDVGLVGIENDATIAASFFDCTVAGNCTADHAETTSTLQTPSHYATAGWNLDTVWGFSGPNSYPCLRWQTGCDCQPTAATDATCNGLDDDCSGEADEDFAPQVVSCGVGACAATGNTSCVGGSVQSSCQPGMPGPSDNSCNGVDNDCNDAVDEDFVAAATSCGIGVCASTGVGACVSGSVVDTCTPGTPGASDATCNGLDDNCSGQADEGYVSFPTSCGVGACLAFGTTFCTAGTVQSGCEPGEPLGTDALCDGVDEDCDGTADEGFVPRQTTCGSGACEGQGASTCLDGDVVDSCEVPCEGDCSDSIDDEGDGAIDCADDECSVLPECAVVGSPCDEDSDCAALGTGASCYVGIAGGYCSYPCDSTSDETTQCPETAACGGSICLLECDELGECEEPTHECQPFAFQPLPFCWPKCPETGCAEGTFCRGLSGTCSACAEADETCDGVDDDCDGEADEDFASVSSTCGFGACASTGVIECGDGEIIDSCTPGTAAIDDTSCNGIDDDCNDEIDEDFETQATDCGVGACSASGLLLCQNGTVTNSCTSTPSARDDASCNAVDDDCDGAVDEDYVAQAHGCGVGACAATGSFECVAGAVQDTCIPGLPKLGDAACDGIDSDCNGAVDEDFVSYLTGCGEGQCFATGYTQCSSGVLTSSCEPGEPSSSDATCDGNDDDCDGDTDEDYAPVSSSCGVGACVASGALSACVDGEVEAGACTPLAPGANDQSCNAIDDDCDGQSDEGYVVTQTQCGMGACARTGQMQCTVGSLSDTCSAPAGASDDHVCDGLDEDCDGAADEDYPLIPTSCGIGACAATGALVCSGGAVHDSCQGGTPSTSDATCDGDDDDCDSLIDEDFVGSESECGVGECAATGWTECVAGELVDSCDPEMGALSDPTCDGADDDCDGELDEDHVPAAASCGVGACSSAGLATCIDGELVSDCQAGSPGTEGATCDAIDGDCDGALDETVTSDSDPCTIDTCDPGTGVVTHTPAAAGSSCSDGNPCDGEETCEPSSCPADMLAFWKGENNANDSATGYHGTVVGPLSFIQRSSGYYLSFPGGLNSARVNLATHVNALNFSGPATLELWINNAGVSCQTIMSVRQDATRQQSLQVGNGCDASVTDELVTWRRINGSTTSTVSVSSTNRALLFFDWHHLALTFDGTTTTVYFDGVQQTASVSGNDHGDWGGLPAPTEANLGQIFAAGRPEAQFVGGMDEVTLYTRTLSATEIASIYTAGIGNKCSGGQAAMTCVAGAPPSISDNDPCTLDVCDPVTGISHPPAPQFTACNDDSVCTLSDRCDGAGHCVAGSFASTGTTCNDSLWCTGSDVCDGAGACSGTPLSDSNACTYDVCDAVLGRLHPPMPISTSCSDGSGCTTSDECNGAGICAGTAVVPTDDGDVCTTDICVSTGPATFTTSHTAKPTGTACDDGDVCNGQDRCLNPSATACTTLPTGAIAYWPFNGHGNDLVGDFDVACSDEHCPEFENPGPFADAEQAFGGDLDLDRYAGELNQLTSATIEMWLRIDVHYFLEACHEILVLREDRDHEHRLAFGSECTPSVAGDLLSWVRKDGAASTIVAHIPGGSNPFTNWTHLAVTFDGTTTRFYIAGSLVSTVIDGGADAGQLGGLASIRHAHVTGTSIDELVIYDRALSAAEIATSAAPQRKCWSRSCEPIGDPLPIDDGNACTHDTCDPQAGGQHEAVEEGTTCTVGDHCTVGSCDAEGECQNSAPALYCEQVGEPCTSDTDCGGTPGFCLTEAQTGLPHGVCTLPCYDDHGDSIACPAETLCAVLWDMDSPPIVFEGSTVERTGCLPSCSNGADCGRGDDASCWLVFDHCQYHCRSDSDCAAGSFCDYYCNGAPCSYMPGQADYDGSRCVVGAASETICTDRRDDDADGFTDCADSDCFGSPDCGELCFNNAHDDADGAQDCEDSECSQPCERCYFDGPGYEDGVDEDLDGLIDCEDPDCQAIGSLCVEGTLEHCIDEIDNDVDGLVDCADSECGLLPGSDCYETPGSGRCNDSDDNDGDGAVDCADPDCTGASNCAENTNARCRDGIDNDADGATDCHDSNCAYDPPSGRTVVVCTEMSGVRCSDDLDNDVDGYIDCLDPGCPCFEDCDDGADNDGNFFTDCEDLAACFSAPECAEECFDDLDNNLDGNSDCDDPRCESLPECEELCSDGLDNNHNGRVDCADSQCDDAPHCEETLCSDGLDNEGDTRTDCADSDCRDLPVADATCNRVNEDCDATFDEDFVGDIVTCGVGACTAQAQLRCFIGSVVNDCEPHDPQPETCDGQDNDCDGHTDESYPRCIAGIQEICNGGVPVVTACNDGDVCNGIETCSVQNLCQPGTPVDIDDGIGCTHDSCDPVLGAQHAPLTEGEPCDDGNPCTAGTTCDASLECVGGSPVGIVDDGNPCTEDICDPELGPVSVPAANGTSCSDLNVCNGLELCVAAVCTPGTAPSLDDGNDCTTDSCQPSTGIAHEPRATGSACDDANPCTQATTCSAWATCVGGSLVSVDDDNPCTLDSCSPASGVVHTQVPSGTACSDSNVCNGDEVCLATFAAFTPVNPSASISAIQPKPGTGSALQPVAHSLSSLGIAPGERLELRSVGSFVNNDITNEPSGRAMRAVFSTSGTTSFNGTAYVVQGRVASDAPTYVTELDVSEDFAVPTSGIVVTVPASAQYLFVAASDSSPQDNVDADGDFGFEHRVVHAAYETGAFLQVNPNTTFLQELDDPRAMMPAAFSLDSLGFEPGDSIELRSTGAWTQSSDARHSLLGAFSASDTVLDPYAVDRLPDAIASGAASFVTPADIAEDFLVPQSGLVVVVPQGATHLILGANVSANHTIGNHSDADNDFGVIVQEHVAAAGCLAGVPLAVDDDNACTTDSCDPDTGAVHTPFAGAQTCQDLGAECGSVDNGCGTQIACGTCIAPEVCGQQEPNRCGAPALSILPSIEVARSVNLALPGNGGVVIEPAVPGIERLTDSPSNVTWFTTGHAYGPRTISFRVGQSGPEIIDRVALTSASAGGRVQVYTSDVEPFAPAQLQLMADEPLGSGAQVIELASPQRARFVRMVLVPPGAGSWSFGLDHVQVLTRAREGGIVSLHEGGAQVLSVSATGEAVVNPQPQHVIDFSPTTGWSTTPLAGAHIAISLEPTGASVDQLELRTFAADAALREFELDLSADRYGAVFNTVLAGETTRSSALHTFDFEPTPASSARLRMLSSHGSATAALSEARLYSQRFGGATVPFNDVTDIARAEVDSWAWDFGDGNTSTEQHPQHTYAEPGTYDVALTITDIHGARSTGRTTYTVIQAPVPAFEWQPVFVEEGGGFYSGSVGGNAGPYFELTDRSVAAPNHRILQRTWSSAPDAVFLGPTTRSEPSIFVRFFNDGDYDVSLSALDSQLLRGSQTHLIEVVNVPPTVDAGSALAGVWGLSTRIGLGTTVRDQGREDHENLLCIWDFGDGHTAEVSDCAFNARSVSHTYADPGTYVATLTAFDDDTSTSDTVLITQHRRFTSLVPEPLVPTAVDGVFVATARLVDAISDTPLAGYAVTISAGAQSHVVTTDALGVATATLTFEQHSYVTVEYAFDGDARYEDATNTLDFVVRDGDVEPEGLLPPQAGQESNQFVIGFPQNAYNIPARQQGNFVGVMITSHVETNATVSVPGLGFSETVHVLPGQSTAVDLPVGVRMGVGGNVRVCNRGDSALIEDKGVVIESELPITVYGFDYLSKTTDGFSAIPVDQLGTEYLVLAYGDEKNGFYRPRGSQVGIVATEDDTDVTITPSEDVEPGPELPNGAVKGVPFTVTLDRLETFQIVAKTESDRRFEDMTGTQVSSSKPVAVFGGHVCIAAGGNAACDHVVEQLPPVSSWGTRFITSGMPANPVFGSSQPEPGEYLRVLASANDTEVRVDGELIATIDRGEYAHFNSGLHEFHEIITSKPALVAQYALAMVEASFMPPAGRQDPFMTIVPAVSQYSTRYELAVATPNMNEYIADRYLDEPPPGGLGGTISLDAIDPEYWIDNRIVVVAPAAEVGGVRIDGRPINQAWVVVGSGEYAVARVRVKTGHHRLSHMKPGVRFAAFTYGYEYYDSFGYSAGMQLKERACTPSASRPADGIDNDCDGIRDEEYLNGIDDDGDGIEDEDLTEVVQANRPPVAYPTRWSAFNAGASTTSRVVTERFALPGFDPDGDPISWSLLSASRGVASIAGNVLSFRDNLRGHDAATIVVQASDGQASSAAVTLQLAARPSGDADEKGANSCETNRPEGGLVRTCNSRPYAYGSTARSVAIHVPPGEVVLYAASVSAHDTDQDEVRYRLVQGPDDLELDEHTGALTWAVGANDIGTHAVTVVPVDYRRGLELSIGYGLSFNLEVVASSSNQLPIISSLPTTSARIGEDYSYSIVATDPESTSLTYALLASPPGMRMSSSGLVTWRPTSDLVGTHSVAVRVTDAQGAGQSQAWTIEVEGSPLRVISAPPLQAAVGVEYSYTPELSDTSGGTGPYVWQMTSHGSTTALRYSQETGLIRWTPAEGQEGVVTIHLQVRNAQGDVGHQYFSVEIAALSLAPTFVSQPVTEAIVGGLYLYDVNAADFGHRDVLTYSLATAPEGMVIDPLSGVVQWIPDAPGTETVAIRVTDSTGLSELQTFGVSVQPDEIDPAVRIVASATHVAPGAPLTLTVVASDNAVVSSRTLAINGVPQTLSGSHQYVLTSSTPGVYMVTATATDASGNTSSVDLAVGVEDATDTVAPAVTMTSPAADAELTYIHDIVGSATDANLLGYRIELRRAGSSSWRLIEQDYAGTASGTLGRIDTTMLENGYHELRVTGEDINGRTSQVVRPVRITGQAKVGTVQLSFTDAVVPMAGIPLVAGRTYDSRKLEKGDFGYGWHLTGKALGSITHNRPLGTDWFVTEDPTDQFGFPCQVTREYQEHYTEVRISDREWWVFKPVLAPRDASQNPLTSGNICQMVFGYLPEPVDGVNDGARLYVNGATDVNAPHQIPQAVPLYGTEIWNDGSTIDVYTPTSFTLVLADGREFVLGSNGVQSITDANDNTVVFNSNGIAHTGGTASLFFERDLQGRITRITDPLLRSVQYGYDLNGDLVRVTDPIGRVTRFSYHPDFPHVLDRIIGPDGREVSALQYNEDGRLTGACQPEAGCTLSDYDLTARTMTQRDPSGREVEYAYDERGNVTSQTDALNNTVEFEYDADDNLIRAEGPDGSVATYTYDGDGNLTSRVLPHEPSENPADFTYTYVNNARGDRETVTLPSSGVIDYDYDARGNMTAVKDGAGNVIEARTFNIDGTLASRTDRFGTVTFGAYHATGQPTSITDAFGQVITVAYDVAGQVTARTERGVTATWAYDGFGRPTTVDYGTGATVRYEYRDNRVGEWTAIEGPTFGRVERTFRSDGKLRSWTEPNGDVHTRLYDSGGRIAEEIDPLGNRTTYAYDEAGRLSSVTDVTLDATTTFERDAAGRVVGTTDALENETETEYRVGGRLASTTNARGFATSFDRTPTSRSITDALTRTTSTSLTQYGLPIGTQYPGGSSTSSAHLGTTRLDGAQGFPTSFEDELERERSFGYDARSGLTSATDLAGEAWSYRYSAAMGSAIRYDVFSGEVSVGHHDGGAQAYADGSGGAEYRDVPSVGGSVAEAAHFLSRVESPSGEVTEFIRGEGGRIESVLYPDGGEKAISYDDRGLPETVTLPQGTTLSFEHDEALRETSRVSSLGEHRAFTYGPGDRVETMTDATGTTAYAYDAAGRFAGIEYPDGGGVHYGRDKLGRTSEVGIGFPGNATVTPFAEYSYDENGNLEEMTMPGGVVSFVYDELDRLTERTLPNGVTTTYGYDARDRVVSVVHTGPSGVLASVTYVRSDSGEPTRITREDGSYVVLAYDAALRVESETYYDVANTVLDAIEYGYDEDGNRTSKTSLGGGHETYAYGAGFRLESIGSGSESYGYDGGGRQVSVTRGGVTRTLEYNSDDKLTRVVDGGMEVARYTYDGAGRRVASVIGGAERRYYVAPNVGDGFETAQVVFDGTGAPLGGYAFAGEHPVAKWTAAGWEYYLQDAMGSVIGMASASGASTATIKYDSFGSVTSAVGASAGIDSTIGTDFRYHGMQLDDVSGLYHVRARTYDARTGRFTSRDPIAGSVGQPESAHPYSFCRASPHLWVDPTGLMSMPELSIVQAGIGILANIAVQAAGAAFRAALATAVIGVGIVAMQQTRDDTRDRTLDVSTDLTRDDDPACVGPSINIGGEGEIPDAININTDLILDPNFVASRDGTTTIRDMQSRGQQFIAYDGSRLPIRSNSCCTVFTKSIPPYVKTQLFLEIRRVLKPNGVWVDYQFVGDAEVPYIRYRKGAFGL